VKEIINEYLNQSFDLIRKAQNGAFANDLDDVYKAGKLDYEITTILSKLTDKVTRIKLAETISNVIKSVKKIKEEHLSAMMMTYELLSELKNTLNK
jgi:hypothetical protein